MVTSSKTKCILIAALLLVALLGMPHADTGSGSASSSSSSCGLVPQSLQSQISANESWYCPINTQIYNQWSAYIPMAALVLVLSFLIAALIFLIGAALNNSSIKNFGIGELYEAIATAVIVVFFLYICAAMFGLLPGSFIGPINPYATSFKLMRDTITTAQTMYTQLYNVYFVLSAVISPTVQLEIGGVLGDLASSLKFLGKYNPVNFIQSLPQLLINVFSIPIRVFFLDPALSIGGILADGILVLDAEYAILIFFSLAAIPIFLIPGIFFRAIFPTRALGGTMIALAIGFYLIMPSLFAVVYYFTAPTVQRDMGASALQFTTLSVAPGEITSQSSPLVMSLYGIKSSLNGFWLLVFFYPSLIIAITYTSVQEISRFIGRAHRASSFIRGFI